MIPNEWKKYPIPSYVSVNVWIGDFSSRLKQLAEVRQSKDYGRSSLWLGGLFLPEAFITATRQAAAQANGWSLENLELEVEILKEGEQKSTDPTSFIATGINLEGALWKNNTIAVSNDISTAISACRFYWRLANDAQRTDNRLVLPVYLSDMRSEFLCQVELPIPADLPKLFWHQRCVAMTTWKSTL